MTIEAGALRWTFEGDPSGLTAAYKKAEEAARESGKALTEEFVRAGVDAGKAIDTFVTEAMGKMGRLLEAAKGPAAKFAQVWSEGADGAVAAVNSAMTSAVDAVFSKLVARMGPIGAAVGLAWEWGVRDIVLSRLDDLKKTVAGRLADALGDEKDAESIGRRFSSAIASGFLYAGESTLGGVQSAGMFAGIDFGPLEGARSKISEWAQSIKETIDEAVDYVRTALQKLAGTFQSIGDEAQKLLATAQQRVDTDKLAKEVMGLTADEAARLRFMEEARLAAKKAGVEWNAKELAAITEAGERVRAAKEEELQFARLLQEAKAEEARQQNEHNALMQTAHGIRMSLAREAKAEADAAERAAQALGHSIRMQQAAQAKSEYQQAEREAEQYAEQFEQRIQNMIATMSRQASAALANANAPNMSAYERAMAQFRAASEGTSKKEDVADTPEVIAARQREALRMQGAADLSFNVQLAESVRQSTEAYDLQTRSLGATAGETARLKFEQTELNVARKLGVKDTDELRAKIEAEGAAIAEAANQAARAADAFKGLMEAGRTVASNLESAFDKWISGSKLTWKDFIQDMEKDLAKLALRQALMPIFGGGSGGSLLGGLFASLAGIPGRAEGGEVQAGQPYIVGERQPELFVPRSAGTIVPQVGGGGGGGPVMISMRVDLSGANGDETIARIAGQAARAAFAKAVEQQPARARSFQLLGA